MTRGRGLVVAMIVVALTAGPAAAGDGFLWWSGKEKDGSRTVSLTPEVWMAMVDATSHHFLRVAEILEAGGDRHDAAFELHLGTALVKMEAGRAEEEKHRHALMEASKELAALEDEIRKGPPSTDLRDVFARTHMALSEHHYALAAKALEDEDRPRAQQELAAAKGHHDHAGEWARREEPAGLPRLPPSGQEILDKAKVLAGKFAKGASWVADKLGQGLKTLGQNIEGLSEKLGVEEPTPEE